MKLICLGDSLTFGYGTPVPQRWTTLASEWSGWQIMNRGMCGDTTSGMLSRLRSDIFPEIKRGDTVVLVMGGSNDIIFSGSSETAKVNIGTIVHHLMCIGVPVLVGIPLPIDWPHVVPAWTQLTDLQKAASINTSYCDWLHRFCSAFNICTINFRTDFLGTDDTVRSELFLDGVHPTPKGHFLMADRLSKELKTLPRYMFT